MEYDDVEGVEDELDALGEERGSGSFENQQQTPSNSKHSEGHSSRSYYGGDPRTESTRDNRGAYSRSKRKAKEGRGGGDDMMSIMMNLVQNEERERIRNKAHRLYRESKLRAKDYDEEGSENNKRLKSEQIIYEVELVDFVARFDIEGNGDFLKYFDVRPDKNEWETPTD